MIDAVSKNDRKRITGKFVYKVKDLLDEKDSDSDDDWSNYQFESIHINRINNFT